MVRRSPAEDWLGDGPTSSESEGSDHDGTDGFRMWHAEEFRGIVQARAAPARLPQPKIVNLIDFSECDVPVARSAGCAAGSSRAGGAVSSAAALPSRPQPQHAQGVQPPVGAVASTTEVLVAQAAAGAHFDQFYSPRDDDMNMLSGAPDASSDALASMEHLVADLTRASEEAARVFANKEVALRGQIRSLEADLKAAQDKGQAAELRLSFWHPSDETIAEVDEEAIVKDWAVRLKQAVDETFGKLEERRIQIHMLEAVKKALPSDHGLCKVCFDSPATCVLMPCKHLALCEGCSERATRPQPAPRGDHRPRGRCCPMCRDPVRGMLVTYPC